MAVLVIIAAAVGAGLFFARHTKPVQTVTNPLKYEDVILESSQRHQVNPYWICAMIERESGWDEDAVSPAGAIGLMQVQEETAWDMVQWGFVDGDVYSPENLSDPATNIEFGCAYLRYLVERYHEMQPAIAAYNAGPGNVDRWLEESNDVTENMDFGETSDYLVRVESTKLLYEELYPDAFPEYLETGE